MRSLAEGVHIFGAYSGSLIDNDYIQTRFRVWFSGYGGRVGVSIDM